METLPIVEIFGSVQGEGRHQGQVVTFVRLSGCTRKCSFCDTAYHTRNQELEIADIIALIRKQGNKIIVWTGGEPTLYLKGIKKIIKIMSDCKHHLETNGDLIKVRTLDFWVRKTNLGELFDYIAISPKDEKVAKEIDKIRIIPEKYDIKIVTDVDTTNKNMLKYATMLMPLTTYNSEKDKVIRQRVWRYCVDHKLFYSGRLHVEVWKQTRGK